MRRLLTLCLATLFFLVSRPGAQDEAGWRRLDDDAVPTLTATPSDALVERHGGRLSLEDGRLVRRYRKQELELGCTLEGGAGRLLTLAGDPFGLTFIAAEAGLFVSSPESEVIDRVRLRDGAPSSAPNSLVFDEARRLWLASDTEFGVLEPSHYFGRSITPPAAGPYRLLGLGSGELVLRCGAELWAYRPDLGPAPRVERVVREGRELQPGALIESTYGESLELELEASARGGAVLRYAVDGSHVWSLLGDLGPEIEPGEHRLELVAMDRDLQLSEPFELRLRVLYPIYYRAWFVISLGLALFLLTFLGFYLPARRRGAAASTSPLAALPRALISTVLILVIGLQALAGAIPHGRGWPFIGYSMYTESRDVGHISYNGVMVGFGKRGVALDIPIGKLGLAADNRWQLLRPIMNSGHGSEPNVPAGVIEKYNREHPDWEQLVRLQVWAKRTLIGAEGPIEIAPLILSDYEDLEPGGRR